MNTVIKEKEIELINSDEVFKPVIIDGEPYHGYWFSNYGRCYSDISCKFITPHIRKKHGSEFRFYKNGKKKSISSNKLKNITFGKAIKSPELIANDEIFRPASYKGKRFDGYLVSNYGRVWSNKSNALLKLQINNDDFVSCLVKVEGKLRQVFVHYLVGYTFLTNPNKLSKIHHLDGNRKNNTVSNLVWQNGNQKHLHKNFDFDVNKIKLISEDELFSPLKIDKKYYNDFYISNYGRCYSITNDEMLKSKLDKYGSAYYSIQSEKIKKESIPEYICL